MVRYPGRLMFRNLGKLVYTYLLSGYPRTTNVRICVMHTYMGYYIEAGQIKVINDNYSWCGPAKIIAITVIIKVWNTKIFVTFYKVIDKNGKKVRKYREDWETQ